jgi:lipid-A-disaccharide synthase
VTGLTEAIPVLARSWRLLREIGETARRDRPDVFVAIDAPDFNFRLLSVMHKLGVPVVYYVSPQLWAWRAGRMKTIRRYVRRMLVIFPFEAALYEQAGVPVEFVGHPLVDFAAPSQPRETFLASMRFDPARPVLALLPGSRPSELRHILPTLVAAMPRVAEAVPGVQFLVARAPALDDALFAPLEALRLAKLPLAIAVGKTDDVLAASDAVLTASGTATVQTALHGKPMAIVYKLSPVTYAIGRAFVRVPAYGMVNLVAGRRVAPEIIQSAVTPAAVAGEANALLTHLDRLARMSAVGPDVRARLGAPGASRRAAEAVRRVSGGAAGK